MKGRYARSILEFGTTMDCETCATTAGLEGMPAWKGPLLVVGALFFCPCHLPVTFGAFALAAGAIGAAWLTGSQWLFYVVFSLVYVGVMVLFVRWFLKSRQVERERERLHQAHSSPE